MKQPTFAAIGQVESERLRITTEYPPEEWDTYLPERPFDYACHDWDFEKKNRDGILAKGLSGKDIDMDRSQGEVGLFISDAGYPFGRIPHWLIKQCAKAPDWAPDWAQDARRYESPSTTDSPETTR